MPEQRESTARGIIHPEWVEGRRIWTDSAMADTIHKLHHGDPTKGWEGDPRLAVYWNPPRFELWRLETDEEYRIVCRSNPGVPFDDRVIDSLVAWDVRRRTKNLHDSVVEHNSKIDAERARGAREFFDEEAAPRMAAALRKDFG